MAAQIHTFEVKVAMKSPEKLVSFFRNNLLDMPKLAPAIVKSCEIMGGGTQMVSGSIFHVTYTLPGATEIMNVKAVLEDVDESGGKCITLRVIKGDVLQKYTTYVSKAVIVDGGGQVTWYVEYEKADPSTPPPLEYIPIYTLLTQAFDNFA
ncbi:unnamed protein product [Linum perenne]